MRLQFPGYLLLSEVQPLDSGQYSCVVSNSHGTASSVGKVLVTDYTSGCADGTTDGLEQYDVINACNGTWSGHVKRGINLL